MRIQLEAGYLKTLSTIAILIAILFGLFLGVSIVSGNFPQRTNNSFETASELQELNDASGWGFQEYSEYFQKLSEAKGAEYAFEILKRAPMREGTDLHLLGHVVGDMLYKQKGIDGIKVCTPDFRNACSHSVVIGMLTEFGEGSLPEITNTCKEAPGGKGAYTMCFHGLGHGVLAYNGYRLDSAVEMCKKTGTAEYLEREYIECVGGATMEMIAGVHDRDAWELQKETYFKKDDPLYPCNASFMPKEVQSVCYVHLTPYLFQRAGMNLGRPDPEFYPKAFSFCDRLPSDDFENRAACFGGFGKEFIGIAQGRDIRDVGSMQEPALRKMSEWCGLAGSFSGVRDCTVYALGSLFWGGENNPDASFRFCSILEGELSRACFESLAANISLFLEDSSKGRELCARLPEQYRAPCLAQTR